MNSITEKWVKMNYKVGTIVALFNKQTTRTLPPAPSSSWQEVHVEFLHVTLGDKVPYSNTENKLSVARGQICCSWYVVLLLFILNIE